MMEAVRTDIETGMDTIFDEELLTATLAEYLMKYDDYLDWWFPISRDEDNMAVLDRLVALSNERLCLKCEYDNDIDSGVIIGKFWWCHMRLIDEDNEISWFQGVSGGCTTQDRRNAVVTCAYKVTCWLKENEIEVL